jgi:hypothetical protein
MLMVKFTDIPQEEKNFKVMVKENELLDRIIQDIQIKYKDFTNPDFRFISKIVDKNPYVNIINEIKRHCKVEEITDINYDVSFVYVLDCLDKQYMLQLSMVGRYATFYRLTSERKMVLIDKIGVKSEFIEKEVIDSLEKNNMILLNEQLLECEINIKVNINDNKTTGSLNECLFTNKG